MQTKYNKKLTWSNTAKAIKTVMNENCREWYATLQNDVTTKTERDQVNQQKKTDLLNIRAISTRSLMEFCKHHGINTPETLFKAVSFVSALMAIGSGDNMPWRVFRNMEFTSNPSIFGCGFNARTLAEIKKLANGND